MPTVEAYEFPEPARLAAWERVYGSCLITEDVYPGVARRLVADGVRRAVEVGGGLGPVSELLLAEGVTSVVVDLEPEALDRAPRPSVRADMVRLPFPDASVDAVVAINTLYFLDDPTVGVREAHRVLRPGGTYVASSPSRFNDPELAEFSGEYGVVGTFDSEDAPAIVGSVFGDVAVEPWDVVAFRLETREQVEDYLDARRVPEFRAAAADLPLPLSITKRGAQVWARR